MSTNLSPPKTSPVSSVKLKTGNVKPPAPPQMPRQKFVRGALSRGTAAAPATSRAASPNMLPAPAGTPASPSSAPSAPSMAFNPPSDMTDPATARAPRAPAAAPSVVDPMDATGSDPYSSSLMDDTGMPSYKKGGMVKRRGWGKARG